jgi:hypothetical protein
MLTSSTHSSPRWRSLVVAALAVLGLACEAPLAPEDVVGVYATPAEMLAAAPEAVAADSTIYRVLADTAILRYDGTGALVTVLGRRVPATGEESTIYAHTSFVYVISGLGVRTRLPPLGCAGTCAEPPAAPRLLVQGDELLVLGAPNRLYRLVTRTTP